MHQLGLLGARFSSAAEVVRWLGAVQAQDFGPAKWSVAMRTPGLTDAAVQDAFDRGEILRTHVLRPTWHLVHADDIRWLLRATAPRVRLRNGARERELGIDEQLRRRGNRLIAAALEGGRHLTRAELGGVLAAGGVAAAHGQRLGYLMMGAELDGVVCSGARRGKQQTYALLDERAPSAHELDDDEALAELTRRYFTSHGPATTTDLRLWATLTVAQVKRGLAMVANELESDVIDGVTHWHGEQQPPPSRAPSPVAHLLQAYDEYVMGYTESRGVMDRAGRTAQWQRAGRFIAVVAIDTQLAGRWRAQDQRDHVRVEVVLDEPLDGAGHRALGATADRYGAFLSRPVQLAFVDAPTPR